MAYTFDYVVAPLRCEKCGLISGEDQCINMQTKICKEPKLSCLKVGARLDLIEKIEDAGYVCLNNPINYGSFTLLDFWSCVHCDEINAAIINILNNVIFSISEPSFDDDKITNINYVSDDYQNYIGWDIDIYSKSIIFNKKDA